MVDFRINWTFYTGEECKAKTNCALAAQFQTLKKHPSKNPTTCKVGAVFNRTDMFIYFSGLP